jgi:D-hydroxyproline dehydrogenase subunit beta
MMRAVVIGAGIVGCAVARELSVHGVAVDLVDRGAPGSATTAHCEGNILVSDKAPGPELALQLLSRRLWPDVLAEIREDCGADATDPVEWEPKGGIVVATTDSGADGLRRFVANQAVAGVTAHAMTADDAHAAEPYLTRDFTAAYHYPDDAQVQPVAATFALLRGARHHGARVHPGVTVTGPVRDRGVLRGVDTTAGRFPADVVVNCAGPWAAPVSELLGAPIAVKPRRGDLLVTTPQPPTVFHKVYDADYVGAVGSGDAGLRTSTVVEATRAGPLIIGSSRERVPLSAGINMTSLEEMARKAIRLFPHLVGVQVMRAYGGFRPYVDDHLPVIGADPRLPGLWHATGHEGGGIGLAVGTAALLRAVLLDHETPAAAEDFRVDRPALVHTEEVSS